MAKIKKEPSFSKLGSLEACKSMYLFHNGHFFNKIMCTGIFIDYPQHVAAVEADATLQVFLKVNVARHGFAVAVESQTDQISFCVNHRASAVTTGDVIIGNEAGGKFAFRIGILAKVFGFVELF